MPKYYITETIACWVEFKYEVEADDAIDARRKYNDGESDFLSCDVGDNIDWVDANEVVIIKQEN